MRSAFGRNGALRVHWKGRDSPWTKGGRWEARDEIEAQKGRIYACYTCRARSPYLKDGGRGEEQ